MQHKVSILSDGDQGIRETVTDHMVRLAVRDSQSPEIRAIAGEIYASSNGTEEDLANKLFDWVYENVQYVYDHDAIKKLRKYLTEDIPDPRREEFVQAPKYLATVTKMGDCDDMATLVASLAIALGIPVVLKITEYPSSGNNKFGVGSGGFSHVYAELGFLTTFDEPMWVPCDPVIEKFGIEKRPIKRFEIFEVK